MLRQHFGRDLALRQLLEVADVHDLEPDAVLVGESALGHAPLQRHLAAFEPGGNAVMPGARLLTLVSLAGCLTRARARAAAQPFAALVRALRTAEGMQIRHLRLAFRQLIHLYEVLNLENHSTNRRVIRLNHFILMVLETERAQRCAMQRRPAIATAHLLDPELARLLTRRLLLSGHVSPPAAPA